MIAVNRIITREWKAEAVSISVICLAFSIALFWSRQAFVVATILWGAALIGLTMTLIVSDWSKAGWTAQITAIKNQKGLAVELALVGSLVLGGLLTRFTNLEFIPGYVHGDEAQHGLIAQQILKGEIQNLFWTGWGGLTFFSFTSYSVSMWAFGQSLAGLRLASALLGLGAIPALYLLLRPFLSVPTAYAAALMLSFSHLHIHFSRVGLNNITSPLLAILALGCFIFAWKSAYKSAYLLTGIFTSLGLLTHFGALIIPITIALVTLFRFKEVIREKVSGYAIMFFAALMTMAPLLVSYFKSPETALARVKGVWVFNNLGHVQGIYQTSNPVTIALNQLTRSYGALFGRGDTGQMYHYGGGIADPLTAFFVVIGVGLMIWGWRDVRNNVYSIWLLAGIFFGATLTIDPPSYTRLVVLAPAIATAAALGLDWLWRVIHRYLPGLWPGVPSFSWALVLLTIAAVNLFAYFKVYPSRDQSPTLIPEVARYLDSVKDRYYVYLASPPVVYFDYPTFRFLAPRTLGEDYREVPRELKSIPGLDIAFVILPHREGDLRILRERFPSGQETRMTIDERNGHWTVFAMGRSPDQ